MPSASVIVRLSQVSLVGKPGFHVEEAEKLADAMARLLSRCQASAYRMGGQDWRSVFSMLDFVYVYVYAERAMSWFDRTAPS